jgi:hypothetical protein
MTNEQLDKLINLLNDGGISNSTRIDILKPLSKGCIYTSVCDLKTKALNNTCPYYFIKNSDKYVGVVQNGGSDLHWYLKKAHRGKGLMTSALKNFILPHILSTKFEQLITIDGGEPQCDFIKSEKIALRVGFKKINEKIILPGTSAEHKKCAYRITKKDL